MSLTSAPPAPGSRGSCGGECGGKNTAATSALLRAIRHGETHGEPALLARMTGQCIGGVRHQLAEENRLSADLLRAELMLRDPDAVADLLTFWLGLPRVRFLAEIDEQRSTVPVAAGR